MSLQAAVLGQVLPCDQALLRALQVVTRNYHLLTSLHSHVDTLQALRVIYFPLERMLPNFWVLNP